MPQLIFRIIALVCFVLSAWLVAPPAPDPVWRRLVSIGFAFLAASFIAWPL